MLAKFVLVVVLKSVIYRGAYGNMKSNVLEAFRECVAVEGDARHILAKFLFYGPAVFKKVTQLSGGEKMRLRLAQLMYQDINF